MKKLYNNILVTGQITPSDIEGLKLHGVTTIINNRPDSEEPGQLTAEQAASLAKEAGIDYHYLPMVNGQPLPDDLVSKFKAVVSSSEGLVLAHCRSGMRSSFIWALGAIADGEVSPNQAIEAAQQAGIPLQNARAVLESVSNSN